MNRIKNIIILLVFSIFFVMLFVIEIPMPCVIHKVFGIFCPACGLTRAFKAILSFDFYSAITYNILSIPLAIFAVISAIWLIYDIVTNKVSYISKLFSFLEKYWIVILVVIVISFCINNI